AANGPIFKTLGALRQRIAGQTQVVDQEITSTMRPQLDQLARRFQMQQDAITKRVSESHTLGEHERQILALQKEITDMRKQVALDMAAPAKPFISPGFDREVGPAQVAAAAAKMVGLQGVHDEIGTFLSEMDFSEDDYDINALAPLPAKEFSIAFKGAAGSGADPARLRLGPDKSPKQVRAKIFPRKIRNIYGDTFPQRRWFVGRERG
ncbi:unnamed protein product, partial [Prorocentrum cordatum]